jgi:multisubunit Na+/H+ antiporter MnhE subunit
MRAIAGWVAWWAVLVAFWLLLTDSVKLAELLTGAVAAALGATAARSIEAEPRVPLRPQAAWLRGLPRALARLPLDSALLALALGRRLLGRPVRGSFRAVRFRARGRDPHSTARLVTAKWLDSLGPNSYVIGIDSEEDLMLVHQLVEREDPASADPMELR